MKILALFGMLPEQFDHPPIRRFSMMPLQPRRQRLTERLRQRGSFFQRVRK